MLSVFIRWVTKQFLLKCLNQSCWTFHRQSSLVSDENWRVLYTEVRRAMTKKIHDWFILLRAVEIRISHNQLWDRLLHIKQKRILEFLTDVSLISHSKQYQKRSTVLVFYCFCQRSTERCFTNVFYDVIQKLTYERLQRCAAYPWFYIKFHVLCWEMFD